MWKCKATIWLFICTLLSVKESLGESTLYGQSKVDSIVPEISREAQNTVSKMRHSFKPDNVVDRVDRVARKVQKHTIEQARKTLNEQQEEENKNHQAELSRQAKQEEEREAVAKEKKTKKQPPEAIKIANTQISKHRAKSQDALASPLHGVKREENQASCELSCWENMLSDKGPSHLNLMTSSELVPEILRLL